MLHRFSANFPGYQSEIILITIRHTVRPVLPLHIYLLRNTTKVDLFNLLVLSYRDTHQTDECQTLIFNRRLHCWEFSSLFSLTMSTFDAFKFRLKTFICINLSCIKNIQTLNSSSICFLIVLSVCRRLCLLYG